jgi:hypothetical protein
MKHKETPIKKKLTIKIQQLLLFICIGLIHAETFKWAINNDIIVSEDVMFKNTPASPHVMMSGSAPRSFTKTVTFAKPFKQPPDVLIAIKTI